MTKPVFTAEWLRKWPHIEGVEDGYECQARYISARITPLIEAIAKLDRSVERKDITSINLVFALGVLTEYRRLTEGE